jgi:transketolase
MTHTPMTIEELKRMAGIIRCDIIEMICTAGAGHPGGSLSATDVVTALYFRLMRIDPTNPGWPDRDRFILSKGHACPVWYAALAERGYFDKKHLATLRRLGSILQGHPDMHKTPGVDMTVGSLGHGFSVGLGMALAGKLRKKDYHVWVVVGDGESQEGSIWEAAMAAPKWKLDNLTVILDRNHLQNDYCVDDEMPIEPVVDKWRVQLARREDRRPLDGAGRRSARGRPGAQGSPDRHHRRDGQGQGSLLHGKRGRLARQGSLPGRGGQGPG